MTARISSSVGRAVAGRAVSAPDVLGHLLVEQVLGERQEDRSGSAAERLAGGFGHGRRRRRSPCAARPPTWRDRRASRPGRSPGTPRGRGPRARPGRSATNIGVESWRAVWMPMPRFVPPTARVARQTAGRPVSCPCASAMNAAAALVAGRDDADPGAFEGVEEPEERLARYGERVADARRAELVGDVAPDGPWTGVDGRFRRWLGRASASASFRGSGSATAHSSGSAVGSGSATACGSVASSGSAAASAAASALASAAGSATAAPSGSRLDLRSGLRSRIGLG